MAARRKLRKPLRGPYVSWNENMVRDLKQMWKAGASGREIAAHLSEFYGAKVSISSVLGKGAYLGLQRKSKTVGRPRTKVRKVKVVKRTRTAVKRRAA